MLLSPFVMRLSVFLRSLPNRRRAEAVALPVSALAPVSLFHAGPNPHSRQTPARAVSATRSRTSGDNRLPQLSGGGCAGGGLFGGFVAQMAYHSRRLRYRTAVIVSFHDLPEDVVTRTCAPSSISAFATLTPHCSENSGRVFDFEGASLNLQVEHRLLRLLFAAFAYCPLQPVRQPPTSCILNSGNSQTQVKFYKMDKCGKPCGLRLNISSTCEPERYLFFSHLLATAMTKCDCHRANRARRS